MRDVRFEPAQVELPPSEEDDVGSPMADGGRAAVLSGHASGTDWLVWDWSRQIDERLDGLAYDVYETAEQSRRLAVIVIAAVFVFVVALSIVIGVILL